MVTRRSPRVGKLRTWTTDPELLQALGEMTVCYAHLTTELRMGIIDLLRLDTSSNDDASAGLIVTADMRFQTLTDTYFSLLQVRHPTIAESPQVNDLRKDIEDVQRERNSLLHSHWKPSEQPGGAVRIRTTARVRQGLRWEQADVAAKDLRALAEVMRELVATIGAVTEGRALPDVPAPGG
jgi:hypothetical protein